MSFFDESAFEFISERAISNFSPVTNAELPVPQIQEVVETVVFEEIQEPVIDLSNNADGQAVNATITLTDAQVAPLPPPVFTPSVFSVLGGGTIKTTANVTPETAQGVTAEISQTVTQPQIFTAQAVQQQSGFLANTTNVDLGLIGAGMFTVSALGLVGLARRKKK